jgi:uncharacterized protein (TIGR03435 family)
LVKPVYTKVRMDDFHPPEQTGFKAEVITVSRMHPIGRQISAFVRLGAVAVPILAVGMIAIPSHGQSQGGAAPPAFEVASVKVNRGGIEKGERTRTIEPGKITYMNASLGEFIAMAYGVKRYQLSGPDWVVNPGSSDRFDVIASAGSPVSTEEVKRMLGPLLVERFHLTFHREMRELPVFELVVAKNGPKIEPSGKAGVAQSMKPDGQGGFIFTNWTMSSFVGWLSGLPSVGRPVIDHTGLDGTYTFDANLFNFTKETDIGDTKRAMVSGDASDAVFSTLQSQLGLKLVAQRATIEIIVIDHAGRLPTEN